MSKENEDNEDIVIGEGCETNGDDCVKHMSLAMNQLIDANAVLHRDGSCNMLNVRTILHLAERIKHETSLIVGSVGEDLDAL